MYFTSESTSLSSAKSHLPTLDHWSKFNAVSHIGQAGAGHLGAVPGDAVVGKTINQKVEPVELLLLCDQAVDQGTYDGFSLYQNNSARTALPDTTPRGHAP